MTRREKLDLSMAIVRTVCAMVSAAVAVIILLKVYHLHW